MKHLRGNRFLRVKKKKNEEKNSFDEMIIKEQISGEKKKMAIYDTSNFF